MADNMDDGARMDAAAQEKQQQEAVDKLAKFVLERMKQGRSRAEIERDAAEAGLDSAEARRAIEKMYNAILAKARQEQPTGGAIQSGLLGGVVAAVVGGVAWSQLTYHTGSEFGIAAWGLGFLAGYAVYFSSGKRKGRPLQIIAALCGLLGVFVGKYLSFYLVFVEYLADIDPGLADSYTMFSPEVFGEFFSSFTDFLSAYDALWVVLAVWTAWGILRGTGIRVPEGSVPPYIPST
jgi:hypothetical protein